MTVTGEISFQDIEGGVWVVRADDGATYQLAGGDRHLKKNGRRAELDGDLEERPTAAMVGPVFRVTRYRFL